MMERRRKGRFGAKLLMALAISAIGLSGCSGSGDKSSGLNPIDWYRDLSGNSAHDTQDQTAANSQNLKEGGKEPYPNLASVPPPPDNAISKADREKMAQSLIADRQNAQYTDQQLRAGQNMAAVPAPAPAVAEALASPSPVPKSAALPASPPPGKMAAAPRAPVRQEALPTAATPPSQQAALPPAATQAVVAPTVPDRTKGGDAKAKRAEAAQKKKQAKEAKAKRGSEKPPQESPLTSPTIAALPQGERSQAAPPSPPGVPRVVKPIGRQQSEELAAATPSRSDADAAAPATGERRTVQAAEINFTPGPYRARILPADRKTLADVAQMAMRDNGRLRVVGYGGASAQGDLSQREFQSFDAALDNAKAVALALTKLGVPASRIDVETVAKVNSPDRAEIFVEY